MIMPSRIAVASRSFSRHPILRAELLARFANVTFNDSGRSLSGDSLVEFLAGHDAAITALERVDGAMLDRLPQLRRISKYGVGLDMLDLPALRDRGIGLGWSGGVNRRSVSELVIAATISLLRRLPEATAEVATGQWRQIMGRQLSERTIGIIGCGHVGKDLAVLLRAFGCRVLAYDIRPFPDFYAAHAIETVDLETLLRHADIVSLHLPLDDSTRNILSADRLALLRPDAIVINAARGGLIDDDALESMLSDGRLAGAFLDVLAHEPPAPDCGLIRLPNVIVTPHVGGSAEEAVLAMGRAAIAGLDDAPVPTPSSEVWRAAGAPLAG